jgi:hypothetical protein
MLLYIAATALIVLGFLALALKSEKSGRAAEENRQMKQVLDDIQAAAMARDGIDHDPDAARRVRERFTR